MYATLDGILQEVEIEGIVLNVNGIGFWVSIPANLSSSLPEKGQRLFLYTSFVLREFSQTLYGFLEKADRDLFEILLEAKGVGPKLALNMIGAFSTTHLMQAFRTQDLAMLSRIPGIGKKTAERLLLDLRDKIMRFAPEAIEKGTYISHKDPAYDAVQALIHLGYSAPIAQEAVRTTLQEISKEASLSQLITCSLKKCRV